MIAVKRLFFRPLFFGSAITLLLDGKASDGNGFTLLRDWCLATVEVFVMMWSVGMQGWVARVLFALSVGVVPYVLVNDALPDSIAAWEWGVGAFVLSLVCTAAWDFRNKRNHDGSATG